MIVLSIILILVGCGQFDLIDGAISKPLKPDRDYEKKSVEKNHRLLFSSNLDLSVQIH